MGSEQSEVELNRRSFLAVAATAGAVAACSMCSLAYAADDDDDDDGGDDAPAALPKGPNDAGAVGDFAKEGGYDTLAKSKQILLSREGNKLYALSAICTHKQFLCKVKEGNFYCPKHASRFTWDGVPAPKPNGKLGPAKKPLTHYAITIDDKKHIIVDTSKPLAKDDPGSFVTLP